MENIDNTILVKKDVAVKSESIASENIISIKDKKVLTAATFAVKDLLDKPLAPIPLGFDTDGQHCYFWSTQESFMMSITPADLKKGDRLFLLCNDWLIRHFTETRDGVSTVDTKRAGSYLLAAIGRAGMRSSATEVRGCGVYFDRTLGRRVINGSDFCIDEDGNSVPRFTPGRTVVYTISNDFSPPPLVDYSRTEALLLKARVIMMLSTWGYTNRFNILMILGWLMQAAQIGARDPRPHLWINGQAGAGKTTLRTFIANLTRGYVLHAASASGSTQAGVRQKLGVSATAVTIDEAETAGAGNLAAAKNMPGFLVLARSAYSSEETDYKGTISGDARGYAGLSSFLFCSIYPPDLNAADRSRIVQIALLKDVISDGVVAESQKTIDGPFTLIPELRDEIGKNILLSDRERSILFYEMLRMSRSFDNDLSVCKGIFRDVYKDSYQLDARDLDTYSSLLTGGGQFARSINEDLIYCAEHDPDLKSLETSVMQQDTVVATLKYIIKLMHDRKLQSPDEAFSAILTRAGASFSEQFADVREVRNEGTAILDILLSIILRIDWKQELADGHYTSTSATLSVGMLIKRLAISQDNDESEAIVNSLANTGLAYRVEKNLPYLVIANSSAQLAERLPAEWQKNKSWCTPIDLIPGVMSNEKRRIGARPVHCRMVPLADTGIFDENEEIN